MVDWVVLVNPNRDPLPSYDFLRFSTTLPENLKSSVENSDTLLVSVLDTNVKIDPEPA